MKGYLEMIHWLFARQRSSLPLLKSSLPFSQHNRNL